MHCALKHCLCTVHIQDYVRKVFALQIHMYINVVSRLQT